MTGVLVPHGDVRRLADEITGLIDDPARRDAMGRAGRSWAAAHDWQRGAESFLEVVGGLVPVPAAPEPAPQLSAVAVSRTALDTPAIRPISSLSESATLCS